MLVCFGLGGEEVHPKCDCAEAAVGEYAKQADADAQREQASKPPPKKQETQKYPW